MRREAKPCHCAEQMEDIGDNEFAEEEKESASRRQLFAPGTVVAPKSRQKAQQGDLKTSSLIYITLFDQFLTTDFAKCQYKILRSKHH